MPKFKVRFVKISQIIGGQRQILQFAEQIYNTRGDKLSVNIPDGYQIAMITEILPDVNEPPIKAN